MYYVVGRCLLQIRLREAGMTQQQLATKLKMSRQQVSHYATNNRVMSLSTAKTIAEAIGCTIDSLYEWEITKKGVGNNE